MDRGIVPPEHQHVAGFQQRDYVSFNPDFRLIGMAEGAGQKEKSPLIGGLAEVG